MLKGTPVMRSRAIALVTLALVIAARESHAEERISDWTGTTVVLQEGDVMSDSVKIHYHTVGEGPLLILIHGIGGFWFDWRHQIPVAREAVQGRGHDPARLRQERSAGRRRALCGGEDRRRRQCADHALRSRQGDDHGLRQRRVPRLVLRHALPARKPSGSSRSARTIRRRWSASTRPIRSSRRPASTPGIFRTSPTPRPAWRSG